MTRDTVMEHLHPTFRHKVELLLQDLAKAKLPFRVFEGFRTPQRQRDLYNQGRSKPGAKVTNADAWSSLHQYGVAADFVLYIDGKWSWDDKGERKAWWKKLHQLALQHHLEPLSWELPHLQLQQIQLSQLRAGHYPPDGETDWAENLQHAISSWRGSPCGRRTRSELTFQVAIFTPRCRPCAAAARRRAAGRGTRRRLP